MIICRRLVDPPTPEQAFERVSGLPWCAWLDSADRRHDTGRWSFLAIDPYAVLIAREGRAWWVEPSGVRRTGNGGLFELEQALRNAGRPVTEQVGPDDATPSACPIPFRGGAVGFVSYEIGSEIEVLPRAKGRDFVSPDLELGFYDVIVGWDHFEGSCHMVSTGLPCNGTDRRTRARERFETVARWIRGDCPPEMPRGALGEFALAPSLRGFAEPGAGNLQLPNGGQTEEATGFPVAGADGLLSDFSRSGYIAAVQEGIERIRRGDIFQINLSQRFTAPAPRDAAGFYLDIRRTSPAPFGAFFRASSSVIASASPERFVLVGPEGSIQSRPIKGTRRRDGDPKQDDRLSAALVASNKDRAENLMIADLIRNDVSRVCRAGTVRASELFRLESYATVHHLVSIIEGRLRPGVGAVDVLRAMFPSGSVTGAPRIRAMEIISELEPVARGPCYGSIGWIGLDGQMDLSVAIRTAVIAGDRIAFHAGGAVVSDSSPTGEYEETLDKARALAAVLSFEI